MRIIGGAFKGRKLHPLHGRATRPTAGKVREAVFNICAERIVDARVLDLFAGTGALGLEAVSRGARRAVFIESDRKTVELIQKNVAACHAQNVSTVICWDILRNLKCIERLDFTFDLVFMDPPYKREALRPALLNLLKTGALLPGAMVVIEHAHVESIPEDLPGLTLTDVRRYGKTLVTLMAYMVEKKAG